MITIFEMIKYPSRVSPVSSDIEYSSLLPLINAIMLALTCRLAELAASATRHGSLGAKCYLCYKREPTADPRETERQTERERERERVVFPRDRIMGEPVIRVVRRNIHRRHQHVEGDGSIQHAWRDRRL